MPTTPQSKMPPSSLYALLLALVLGVGCGENNNPAKNPAKGLTIENFSGVYEREVDGMLFKLVIDKSGNFKDYFQNLFGDLSGSTFMEQAGGNCKIVEKEIHFHYQAPADLAESGRVHIFRVLQDGSLALIAGIANGKRHDLSEEEQAETHDWLKRSDSVANKGFRIVNPKPTPAFTKEQEAKELLDAFGNDDPPDSASSSDAPLSPEAKTTWNQIGNLESALAFYYFDMQTFPSTTDGLAALLKPPADKNKARKWDGPYLEDKTIPADAWGNTFVYEYSPRRRQDFPHISSLGSDGSAKTKDDILNWGTAATKRRKPEIEMMMETDIGVVSSSSSSPQPEVTPAAQPTTKPTTPKKEALAWKSDPGTPQNALVEKKIRSELNKPTGELTGADLEKVVNLTFLFKLNDKGINEVAKLKRLRRLLLVKTGITNAGLRDLATLPELLSVTISGSDITDAGLKELAKLRQLEELGLPATPVTDQGLKELAKLKNLYSINLKGTKVAKVGVTALQKVLPSCNILHSAKK